MTEPLSVTASQYPPTKDELLLTARRWLMWLADPSMEEVQTWLDQVEVALNPPRTPCPICPHWMEVHNPDGTCGCGAHG